MSEHETTRRDLLKLTAAAAAGTAALAAGLDFTAAAETAATRPAETIRRGDMFYRKLGRTGETVSIVGVGGHHMGNPSEDEGVRIVRTAIDRGINFMDNSWDYHNGGSEERMGRALLDGYRGRVFLMTKINGRDKKKAAAQLDQCLTRLQTDHLDLIQHHAIEPKDDPEQILGENGAHAALVEAQKAGKVRFIGFTGHRDPHVHLRMLETARKRGIAFATVQMPLNVMDAHFKSFEKLVLPELLKDGIGVLGMKSMGMGKILTSGVVKPIECLHYAMNLPTSVVITGMDSMKVLEQALEAARTFTPMTAAQVEALLARTKAVAEEGKFEDYKVSADYHRDAAAMEWMV